MQNGIGGLVGRVTAWSAIRRGSSRVSSLGDGRRRAWQGPGGREFQLRSGCGGTRSHPLAKKPISDQCPAPPRAAPLVTAPPVGVAVSVVVIGWLPRR